MADTVKPMAQKTETSATGWRGSLFGLGAALCWAISPIFIRYGLAGLPSPLLGVSVGMILTLAAYGVALLLRRRRHADAPIPRQALMFQLVAGTLLGLSTWAKWIALDLIPVGVVLALGRLSVPVVIFLAPLMVGQHVERVTARVWLGAALIVSGSLLLILYS